MVRHIVLWSLEGNLTKQEKKETVGKIKELLEPIKEKVPGAVKVEVIINELDSSNRDVALISEFTDTEALAAYQVHPDHLAAKEYLDPWQATEPAWITSIKDGVGIWHGVRNVKTNIGKESPYVPIAEKRW